MQKQTKAKEFSQAVKQRIWDRDGGRCIFCRMKYRPTDENNYQLVVRDIMHYIPRSAGGLGIEENGAVGCRYHHHMLDNGNEGVREEMLEKFADYLRGTYGPYWDQKKKKYSKWEGLRFVR